MKRKLYQKIWDRIDTPEAIVVTGMRRVGKTVLLRQVYDDLASQNKLFLDLENPVNQKYFEEENYEAIRYQLEVLGVNSTARAYIFLDEIQFVKNVPSVVKYLMDHYPYKFFLTGSASFYLKNLFSESLAGRKILYELFPLDFAEFIELKGQNMTVPRGKINEALYQTVIPLYREYVEYGGFPGVVGKSSLDEKKEALKEIFTSYFNKEVLGIGAFRNNAVVRDLLLLLAARVGNKIDVQKLSAELGVSRVTINEYLAFLEGTYFITLVSPHSTNRDTEIRGAKKVYLCDTGLLNTLGNVEFGAVFENMIFHQFRNSGEVKYYQRKSLVEVDFVVNGKESWEVKTKASSQDLKRVERLGGELELKKNHVVSFEWVDLPVTYGFQI
ncbi:MAG: ATP-binding protein [Patescibacteria group bacterium]